MESKNLFKSKTFWASVLVGLAGYVPAIQMLLEAEPALASTIVGVVFAILRATTSDRVTVRRIKEGVESGDTDKISDTFNPPK
jgi:hypothetical protein